MKNVAILLSGRGSNFVALAEAIERGEIPARIVAVISDLEQAPGLEHARDKGYPSWFVSSRDRSQEGFDRDVVSRLDKAGTEIVCLAGFMRLLSPYFVRKFPTRVLNIHPSLLPSFPGLHAQRQAVSWGARVSGCTVHFVDEELDHGPIILQRAVPVMDDDDENALSARILQIEHQVYPEALRLVCQDRVKVEGRRTILVD